MLILDSTALLHLRIRYNEMQDIISNAGQKTVCTTRINYLELYSGSAENAKLSTKKYLDSFHILEFNKSANEAALHLARRYRFEKSRQKDFLILAIAMANKCPILTENERDFKNISEVRIFSYRIGLI